MKDNSAAICFVFIFLLLNCRSSFSQFLYRYQPDTATSAVELIIFPNKELPDTFTFLGEVKSPGLAPHMDFNNQLHRLAKRAVEKGANIIRINEFYFSPATANLYEECRMKGEIYKTGKFEELKQSLQKSPVVSEFSEMIFYRPQDEYPFSGKYSYTILLDTTSFEVTRFCNYILYLKNNGGYTVKIKGTDQSFWADLLPGHKTYVRCTLSKKNYYPLNPGISILLGGFYPKVDVIENELAGELDYYQTLSEKSKAENDH